MTVPGAVSVSIVLPLGWMLPLNGGLEFGLPPVAAHVEPAEEVQVRVICEPTVAVALLAVSVAASGEVPDRATTKFVPAVGTVNPPFDWPATMGV